MADQNADYEALPDAGLALGEMEAIIERLLPSDRDPRGSFSERWLNDRGLLLDDGALEVAKAAHLAFFTKNNSSAAVMPLEAELVAWLLSLFRARRGAAGALTTGGSESLFLATAAALARFRRRHGSDRPCEAVIPATGYPTFEKYSRYLGYEVRRVPVDQDFRADADAMDAAVTDRTFMVLGSVTSWAHGACDPIPALAEIATRRDVWLHVDACVGGMLAPFARNLGRDLPEFDFSVPGVCSMSVDLHKYGYSAKGVSAVLFRDNHLASDQTFAFDEWSAGLYRSPVFTGTRSGGAIASAWAVARYLGQAGYRRRTAQVLKARDAVVRAVESSRDLMLLGGADLGTVAIGSRAVDMAAVFESMQELGWGVNGLKDPPGIQLVLGPLKDAYIQALVDDLGRAAEMARGRNDQGRSETVVYSDEVVRGPGSLLGTSRAE